MTPEQFCYNYVWLHYKPMNKEEMIDYVLGLVREEVLRATSKFQPFNSAHEGWAVLKEEVDELWEDVKSDRGYEDSAQKEAVQCAAMAIRYVMDCCIETPEDRLMKSLRPIEDHDYSTTV